MCNETCLCRVLLIELYLLMIMIMTVTWRYAGKYIAMLKKAVFKFRIPFLLFMRELIILHRFRADGKYWGAEKSDCKLLWRRNEREYESKFRKGKC